MADRNGLASCPNAQRRESGGGEGGLSQWWSDREGLLRWSANPTRAHDEVLRGQSCLARRPLCQGKLPQDTASPASLPVPHLQVIRPLQMSV
eukprot:scaffold69_cov248-Pinguiococcus_pyrenoidosus.AAC.15